VRLALRDRISPGVGRQKCFDVKARPEWVFRYFSKAVAFLPKRKGMAFLNEHFVFR